MEAEDQNLGTKIEARMGELREDPSSVLETFDVDNDGELSEVEWAAVEAMVARQVLGHADEASSDFEGELIGDYLVLTQLGEGAQGTTFLVRSKTTNQICALKRMHLDSAEDWKAIELFERESKVLSNLSHASIPKFVEFFETEDDGLQLNLVQEFIPGADLRIRLERGELFTSEQIEEILNELLDIFDYIHGHSPPVVHRDVKPSNIILTDDDRVVLVDFGAVQFRTGRGTTVVGTTGYMPPEQLMGHAVPSSDYYSAAAAMIHVATRTHPADLPIVGLKPEWVERAALEPNVEECLDALLEPIPEQRPESTDEIRKMLEASTSVAIPDLKAAAVRMSKSAQSSALAVASRPKDSKDSENSESTELVSLNRLRERLRSEGFHMSTPPGHLEVVFSSQRQYPNWVLPGVMSLIIAIGGLALLGSYLAALVLVAMSVVTLPLLPQKAGFRTLRMNSKVLSIVSVFDGKVTQDEAVDVPAIKGPQITHSDGGTGLSVVAATGNTELIPAGDLDSADVEKVSAALAELLEYRPDS